jgi:hypothetical protein
MFLISALPSFGALGWGGTTVSGIATMAAVLLVGGLSISIGGRDRLRPP